MKHGQMKLLLVKVFIIKLCSNYLFNDSAIDCGILQSPANGRVDFTATTFTSIAAYYCSEGFRLNGNETRECLMNGEWSGAEPQCIGK